MLGVEFDPGFFFSAFGDNGSTKFVVNICGHESVGWPLARNMTPVPDDYLDTLGLDNLIIPIAVEQPKKLKNDFDYGINVVVHSCLAKRITRSFHFCNHYIQKLTTLSLEWIQKESGVKLLPRTCKLLGIKKKYSLMNSSLEECASPEEVMKAAAAAAASFVSEDYSALPQNELRAVDSPFASASTTGSSPTKTAAIQLPKELQLDTSASRTCAYPERKKPLVKEILQEKGIKKGFLADAKKSLYGEEGTKEGCGKVPDPLAHIPESLRKRCVVIDARHENNPTVVEKKENMQKKVGSDPSFKNNPISFVGSSMQNENTNRESSTVFSAPPSELNSVMTVNEVPSAVSSCSITEHTSKASQWGWMQISVEEGINKIVATFQSPECVRSMKDVSLEVTADKLFLDKESFSLSRSIDVDNVQARFIRSRKELVISCPLLS